MAAKTPTDFATSNSTDHRAPRHDAFAIARSLARTLGTLALAVVLALSADASGKKGGKKGKGDSSSAGSDSSTATATPTIPLATLPVCLTEFTNDASRFDELLAAYEGGKYKAAKDKDGAAPKGANAPYTTVDQALNAFAAHILTSASETDPQMCPGPLYDGKRDRLAFVFIDDRLAQPAAVRVLQATDPRPSPGSIRLLRDDFCDKARPAPQNGVAPEEYPDNYQAGCSLFTIYLYRTHTSPDITTTYTATPTTSPTQGSLAQAIGAIATGVGGLATPLAAAKPGKAGIAAGAGVESLRVPPDLAENPTLKITARVDCPLPLTVGEREQTAVITIDGGTPPYSITNKGCISPGLTYRVDGRTITFTGTPLDLRPDCIIVDSTRKTRQWSAVTVATNPMSLVTRTVISSDFDYAQVTATDSADLAKLFEPDAVQRRAQRGNNDKKASALNSAFHDAATKASEPHKKDPTPASGAPIAYDELLRNARSDAKTLKEDETAKAIYRFYTAASNASAPGSDSTATTTTTYTFGTRTFITLGVGAGAIIFKTHLNEPITVSSGTIATNQPNGVMTSVNLYLPLRGYDESTLRPSPAERVPRFVLGFVATPFVGGFGGVAFPVCVLDFLCADFSRGLSVNAGYTVMVTNVLSDNAQIGDSAKEGTNRRGPVGGWALQLGYSF